MATQIEKNTARLMLKKLQAKLDRLYATQEAEKTKGQQPTDGGMPKYHYGGGVPHTHQGSAQQTLSQGYPYKNQFNVPYGNTLNDYFPNPTQFSFFGPNQESISQGPLPGDGKPWLGGTGPIGQAQGPLTGVGMTYDPESSRSTSTPYPSGDEFNNQWAGKGSSPQKGVPAPTTVTTPGTSKVTPNGVTPATAGTTLTTTPVVDNGSATPGYSMMNNYDNTAFGGSAASDVLPGGVTATPTQGEFNPADFAFGVDPRAQAVQQMGSGPSSAVKGNITPYTGTNGTPEVKKDGTDWANVGMSALGMAPILYNLWQGAKKPQHLNQKDFQNPYANDARQAMRNRRYNVRPQLAMNAASQHAFNRNVANTGSSRGELLSNFGAGNAGRMSADAQAWAQKQNMDNSYLGEQAQMDAALGQQYAQTKLGVQNINDQNEAARRNYLAASAGQLSQFGQAQQMMRNQRLMDKNKMGILNSADPHAYDWFSEMMKKYGYGPKTQGQ